MNPITQTKLALPNPNERTQAHLARSLNVSKQYILRLEQGVYNLTPDSLNPNSPQSSPALLEILALSGLSSKEFLARYWSFQELTRSYSVKNHLALIPHYFTNHLDTPGLELSYSHITSDDSLKNPLTRWRVESGLSKAGVSTRLCIPPALILGVERWKGRGIPKQMAKVIGDHYPASDLIGLQENYAKELDLRATRLRDLRRSDAA